MDVNQSDVPYVDRPGIPYSHYDTCPLKEHVEPSLVPGREETAATYTSRIATIEPRDAVNKMFKQLITSLCTPHSLDDLPQAMDRTRHVLREFVLEVFEESLKESLKEAIDE